jgi:hypothetical protein
MNGENKKDTFGTQTWACNMTERMNDIFRQETKRILNRIRLLYPELMELVPHVEDDNVSYITAAILNIVLNVFVELDDLPRKALLRAEQDQN